MTKLSTIFLLIISIPVFSQKNINLKYTFQPSDNYIVTTNIYSQSIQEVADSPQKVSTDQQIIYQITFPKNHTVPNYDISLKFKKITSSVNQSGYKQFFSSDSSNNDVSDIFKQFISKTLHFQLSQNGQLMPLYTIDSLFPNTSDESLKFIFSQSVEQKINTNLPFSIIFPDSSVQSGDSWNVKDTVTSGIFNFYNKIYTLDSISEKKYFISEKNMFSTDKNHTIPMNMVYITYDVKGLSENNYILDKKSCIILNSKINQTGSGTVIMKYNKNSDPAYLWKMTVNNTINLTTEKIND